MRILLAAIYPYAFLLLYLIIPFDNYIRALPNILLGILVLAFPFVVQKEDFKKLRKPSILLFLAFFSYLVLNAFFSGSWETDFSVIKKVLIAVGLVILYLPIADFRKINKAIVFSSLAAILFTIYTFALKADASANFSPGTSSGLIESLLIDRLYLGLLSVLSILVSFRAIKFSYHPENNYYLANIFINLVFLYFIGSKIAFVVLFAVFLLSQFYGRKRKLRLLVLGGGLLVFLALFFLFNKDTKNAVANPNDGFMENSMTWEIRSLVWKCGLKIAGEEGFSATGIGFSETENRLVSCYATADADPERLEQFVARRYNTHNQFLDFYLGAGLIGLLLFVALLFQLFVQNRRKFFPAALWLTLVLYCLVENVFHRQIGAYYIGFVLIVLLAHKNLVKEHGIQDDN